MSVISGCSRSQYRQQADCDVARIYQEKRAEEQWTLPELPGIEVDPRSRLYDGSPPDCPALPPPDSYLNNYQLPELVTGDPNAKQAASLDSVHETDADATIETQQIVPHEPTVAPVVVEQVSAIQTEDEPLTPERPKLILLPATDDDVTFTQLVEESSAQDEAKSETDPTDTNDEDEPTRDSASQTNGLRIVAIPDEFWSQLPETCVPRMLVFDSVQKEFQRSFADATESDLESVIGGAPRLTLPNVMELALLNNRDYQTRKETLYRVALRLSGQRYQYELRPTSRGNGSALNYSSIRNRGRTVNQLGIPTSAAITKTTASAGQFLARFANDVVLTFNGPQGFTADVGSELLFDFQQTLFQRDVVFEPLTQAERDVVYAARELIRFRRTLFVDLAGRYYSLLLTYRAIEISTQDYFSNLRAFLQGRAEYLQAGRIPRFQVDQFEQNALRSRSSLVADCNRLESSLDQLKLNIGLPPEMSLDIDLDELEALTASDELTVTRQLVQRTKRTLIDASQSRLGDRNAAVNGATVLVNRLLDTLRVRREIGGGESADGIASERETKRLAARLALLEARIQGDQLAETRDRELMADVPPPPLIQFARTIDLIDARLIEVVRASRVRNQVEDDRDQLGDTEDKTSDDLEEQSLDLPSDDVIDGEYADQVNDYRKMLDDLVQKLETAIDERELAELPVLVKLTEPLLERVVKLSKTAVGDLLPDDDQKLDQVIVDSVANTVELVDRVETSDVGGLDPVDVSDDQAMLAALVKRLDLMNRRGDLADARRQIKLAADDLRSILDIRATHALRTRSDVNRGFDFTFDDSETRLSLALDTPLNRRFERNDYRSALIDYNATRRALIEREDFIKFDVRDDLRQLRLRRNQYEIAVASAALAYERVVSTRLQLQLAVGNVVARDFLEAQQAYTAALNSVAEQHISFILGRIDLFIDTESIRLDQFGYWDGVANEQLDLPPTPDFYEVNPNPYGRLPPCLKYSDEVRANH